MVKNPLSKAGNMGSIPGRGIKIPHALGQLSPLQQEIQHAAIRPDAIKKK